MSNEFFWGTGRRKTSVARVRLCKDENKGSITINKRPLEKYCPLVSQREIVLAPLHLTGTLGKYEIFVNVNGGGVNGQAGAILLGIARALCKANSVLEEKLRSHGYLTRDSRMKERKKYGQRGARASFQFSKR